MRALVSFLALFATWLALSGRPEPWLLAAGAASSAGVVLLVHRLRTFRTGPWPLDLPRLALSYLPWLAWEVLRANLDVAWRVWHPALPIQPQLVRIPKALRTDAGVTLLANSITLTPGTVTVAVEGDELLVHSLSETSTRSLEEGEMQRRVAALERGR